MDEVKIDFIGHEIIEHAVLAFIHREVCRVSDMPIRWKNRDEEASQLQANIQRRREYERKRLLRRLNGQWVPPYPHKPSQSFCRALDAVGRMGKPKIVEE